MANLILHKDGAYNLYTTIADGACFESALTLDQLTEYVENEHGEDGLRNLPARLVRAHETGCSSLHGETLADCIACNRAGPDETELSFDEFVVRYLTLNGRSEMTDDEITDLWERSATTFKRCQTQVNWFAMAIIASEREACIAKAREAIAGERVAAEETEEESDFAYNQALADADAAVFAVLRTGEKREMTIVVSVAIAAEREA